MRHSQEELDKKYEEAPEIAQKMMFSAENIGIVRKIGTTHKLHVDQIGILLEEIDYVLLGLEPSSNFVKNLEESLKVDRATAENIAQEANQEIFLKIRESLKQMEENKNTPKPEELLHELEQHTSPASLADKPSIFERKLSEPVNLKPEVSTPTPATPAPEIPIKKIDPYHEPIE